MARDAGREERVEAVRRFNRFYTRRIGVVGGAYLGSPWTLAEVRVLYEIAHREGPTAAEIARDLGLDPGYMSRILRGFRARGLLLRSRSDSDGRKTHLSLTGRGRAALAPLDARARKQVAAMLRGRPEAEVSRLLGAMRAIEGILGDGAPAAGPFTLRDLRPGDGGWVVERHGALYARERGWRGWFESLVAGVVARFLEGHDPRRERFWIAERDGERVGSVLLVRKSAGTARLRLLLVEPSARGAGLGTLLVDECLRFAREAGYRRVVLWTDAGLAAARRIYERAGFRLVREEEERFAGTDLAGQHWEIAL